MNSAWFEGLSRLDGPSAGLIAACLIVAYLTGSIPWAYIIVKRVTGEDITTHGTGNVGAMNVRRTTGSWGWFVVAMLADFSKGAAAVGLSAGIFLTAGGAGPEARLVYRYMSEAAVIGVVLGHNYSLWLALLKRRFVRTGKGLAAGAGALLVYDPVYFGIVLVAGLGTIALTRYMMAGQVAAALALPVAAIALGREDWPFALAAGLLVYAAHHRRFVGLLQGREPKLYVEDRMGPRG